MSDRPPPPTAIEPPPAGAPIPADRAGPAPGEEPVLFHDFDPALVPAVPSVAPVVVVPVPPRSRGWWSPLLLPSLIVGVAVVVSSWRLPAPRWVEPLVGPGPLAKPSAPAAATPPAPPVVVSIRALPAAPRAEAPAGPARAAEPAAVERSPLEAFPPLAAGVPLPAAELLRPRASAAPADLVRLRREAEQRLANPEEADGDETGEALAAIEREAAQRRAEQAEARALMAQQPALEQQHRIEARAAVEEERRAFRTALRQILAEPGDRAGAKIQELVDRSPAEPPPGAVEALAQAIRQRGGKLDRRGRIALLRSLGMPEPVILDLLFREQLQHGPARNGPKTRNEAIVRAARLLLDAAPPAPAVTAATGHDAGRGTQ